METYAGVSRARTRQQTLGRGVIQVDFDRETDTTEKMEEDNGASVAYLLPTVEKEEDRKRGQEKEGGGRRNYESSRGASHFSISTLTSRGGSRV